ncbi:branched-chain amino acid ABC transporter permease [Nocardioides sp. CCNWLW239]|uniref:branched-chain amino acid ABC transporter permease n=1 Tax=Nocardioides sp. CCNWLW239 TaxID=3128902 RepID=UPI003016D066
MERLSSFIGPLVRPVRSVPLAWHLLVGLLAFLVVATVIGSSSQYLQTRYAEMAFFAIAAGGLTLLTGLSGQLSLGHGALMAVGAYAATLVLERTGGETLADVFVALLVAIAVCAVVGVIVGVPAARLHGPYIAGATLTLAVAVPRLANQWEFLGGEQGLQVPVPRAAELPAWIQDLVWFFTAAEIDQYSFLAYLGWLLLILAFVALANLSRSRVGRRWRAVRDDDVSAELAGIHLGRARVVAFTVSAMCAGLAGGLMAMNVRLTAPGAFTITLSLTLLAAVVLGGLGSLTGALIGAGVLAFLPHFATDLGESAGLSATQAAEVTPVVYGLVLMLVILLAPAGIVGSLRLFLARSSLGSSTKEKTT